VAIYVIVHSVQSPEQLELLLNRVEAHPGQLSFEDTREMARLYRFCSARLAVQRSRGRDLDAIRYLNALCVRAYTRLQVPTIARQRLPDFVFADFPKVLAATAWLQAVVAIVTLAGAVAGASVVSQNPAALYDCIPSSMYPSGQLDTLMESHEARAEFLERKPVDFGWKSIFSAALFTHNLSVGMLAFAVGILAGIPTLILVFYNGLVLGAFAWLFSRDSLWPMFWAWMLPHAIPELLGVTLCSTAGLMLAKAVVAPGRQTVSEALQAVGRPSLEMVAASVPLFIVAAFIESFVRQSMLSTPARFVAAATALGLIGAYVRYVVRLTRRPVPPDLSWLLR
jgi:uncharacterized membrane protein SpoIIM required for sporulation